MRKSASFTGLKVSCPVDACLNLNCVKCHFWCVPHKTHEIAVRIEISVFTVFSSFVFQPLGSARLKIPAYENTKNMNLVFKCWQWIHLMLYFQNPRAYMPVAHGNDKPHYMLPVQFLPAVRHECLVSNDYSTSQGAPDGTCHDYRAPCHYSSK